MKGIINKTLCAIFAIIMSFYVVGCDSQPSKKSVYNGFVSEEVYTEKQEAAEGFILNEIKGEDEIVEFTEYEMLVEMNGIEILVLNPDGKKEDFDSGERGTIKYKIGEKEYENYVCILESNGKYRYLVEKPYSDERVNKRYFDYVVGDEIYDNVTVTTQINTMVESEEQIITFETKIVFTYTEEVVFCQYLSSEYSNGQSKVENYEWYFFEDEDGKVVAYGQLDTGVFVDKTAIAIEKLKISTDGSLRSFGEKAKKNEFKHWCFIYEREKTDRFVLTEDGFKILNNRLIDEHFRGDYGTIDTASYSITLENDKIKSIDKSFHGETQTAMFSMVTTSSFSLFGKSVVELPEQLQVIFPSSEEV